MDKNIIGFKLTMRRSAFDIATKGGNKDLIRLSEAQKVWLPHEAEEEARRNRSTVFKYIFHSENYLQPTMLAR